MKTDPTRKAGVRPLVVPRVIPTQTWMTGGYGGYDPDKNLLTVRLWQGSPYIFQALLSLPAEWD